MQDKLRYGADGGQDRGRQSSTNCSRRWWASAVCSPPWATTTSPSTGWRGATVEPYQRPPADRPGAQVILLRELPLHRRHPARPTTSSPVTQDLREEALSEYGDGRSDLAAGVRWRRARRPTARARIQDARGDGKAPNFQRLRHPLSRQTTRLASLAGRRAARRSRIRSRRSELLRPR